MITQNESEVLKGFAILFVLLGHGYQAYMSGTVSAISCLAGTGVFFFLTISGYGLVESYNSRGGVSRSFIKNRIFKVYIPYVLVIIFESILLLYCMGLRFSILTYLKTLIGYVNYYEEFIDPTLWYITFILLCYILFICIYAMPIRDGFKLLMLWSVFAAGWFCDVYVVLDWKFNYFSFCIGCSLNYILKAAKRKWPGILNNTNVHIAVVFVGIIGTALTAKGVGNYSKPYRVTVYAFFVFLMVIGIIKLLKHWALLAKVGKVSYFIYLTEGAVLTYIGAVGLFDFMFKSFILGCMVYFVDCMRKKVYIKIKMTRGRNCVVK